MDISAEYIEMCEKAEEIQEFKRSKKDWYTGDWYFNEFYGMVHIYSNEEIAAADVVWLPRQDQLQAIPGNYFCARNLEEFRSFAVELPESPTNCYSYEMAWLAFVMKKKFGKAWNGEEWIKEKRGRKKRV